MLRAVFEFMEYEVESYLYMDSAAARGMAKREGVGKVKCLEVKTSLAPAGSEAPPSRAAPCAHGR
eukprot:4129135-Heterocapsa_arctica.AAC.1